MQPQSDMQYAKPSTGTVPTSVSNSLTADHKVELIHLQSPGGRVTKWGASCTCRWESKPMSRKMALAAGQAHYDDPHGAQRIQ